MPRGQRASCARADACTYARCRPSTGACARRGTNSCARTCACADTHRGARARACACARRGELELPGVGGGRFVDGGIALRVCRGGCGGASTSGEVSFSG
jgi:hypothetical protein